LILRFVSMKSSYILEIRLTMIAYWRSNKLDDIHGYTDITDMRISDSIIS